MGQESKGTTNLITPEKVASAMRLARDGIVVSLAHAEPQTVAANIGTPGIFHRVTNNPDGGTTDNYQVSYHGQTIAHIDTWCHFFENGMMYNGVPVKDNLNSESGCIKGSVMNWKGGVTTRAVIYDIPQLKGVDVIDPNVQIRRADRGLGGEIGRQDRPRRHSARLHRPVEAARRGRRMVDPGRRLLPRCRRGMSACRPSSATISTSTGTRGRAGRGCATRSMWRC